MFQHRYALLILSLLVTSFALPSAEGQRQRDPDRKQQAKRREDPQQRSSSLQAICKRLKVAEGDVIADIGAGNGRDSWTFAGVVGETGKVYSEEIEESKCESIKKGAEQRKLTQIHPVLGNAKSPELPADSVDMAFMHHVYHHVSQPREMLGSIWKSLKPGGHLVIVDQRLGTLTDWVPREERAKKHHWIAETTVVREARETGYLFVDYAEPIWHAKGSFVLIFKRPTALKTPDHDPDALPEVSTNIVSQLLPTEGQKYRHVAFVALGEGRKLIAPLLKATSSTAVDIVLEEWATQKEERPPASGGTSLPSVLTESGNPNLGPEPIDAVYFLDTYHLLFHAPTLLGQLRERLTDDGLLYVLDRASAKDLSHREASHRRMIPPQLVTKELQQAGFVLVRKAPAPGSDRFLMVFGKAR